MSSFLTVLLGWLPMLEDLFQIAAPIVEAHTTGKASQIASAVDSAATALQAVNTGPANPTAQGIASTINTLAPIVGAIVNQVTLPSGHVVTVTAPVKS